jgi:hypothetical protein
VRIWEIRIRHQLDYEQPRTKTGGGVRSSGRPQLRIICWYWFWSPRNAVAEPFAMASSVHDPGNRPRAKLQTLAAKPGVACTFRMGLSLSKAVHDPGNRHTTKLQNQEIKRGWRALQPRALSKILKPVEGSPAEWCMMRNPAYSTLQWPSYSFSTKGH